LLGVRDDGHLVNEYAPGISVCHRAFRLSVTG
jgi:hypothetical protein